MGTEGGGVPIGYPQRAPARVLGCLAPGTITVLVPAGAAGGEGPGAAGGGAGAGTLQLRLEAVPPDLRMPNSEFDVWFDPRARAYAAVLRKGEPDPPQGEP